MDDEWGQVWQQLRDALTQQPSCDEHPEYPCVLTLQEYVPNDIIDVNTDRIVVRSHEWRTREHRFLTANLFRRLWDHLQRVGSASLRPGDPNNPHRESSSVVGAIWARCLPEIIFWDPPSCAIWVRHPKQLAWRAFLRDLPQLYAERPGQWVAYHGERRIGFSDQQHLLYQQCFAQGLPDEEFVIFCIEPQETEIWLNPDVLD